MLSLPMAAGMCRMFGLSTLMLHLRMEGKQRHTLSLSCSK